MSTTILNITPSSLEGWPTCMQCHKPVDKITRHYKDNLMSIVIFSVYCHGKIQTIEFNTDLLDEDSTFSFDGPAFELPKLLV